MPILRLIRQINIMLTINDLQLVSLLHVLLLLLWHLLLWLESIPQSINLSLHLHLVHLLRIHLLSSPINQVVQVSSTLATIDGLQGLIIPIVIVVCAGASLMGIVSVLLSLPSRIESRISIT